MSRRIGALGAVVGAVLVGWTVLRPWPGRSASAVIEAAGAAHADMIAAALGPRLCGAEFVTGMACTRPARHGGVVHVDQAGLAWTDEDARALNELANPDG